MSFRKSSRTGLKLSITSPALNHSMPWITSGVENQLSPAHIIHSLPSAVTVKQALSTRVIYAYAVNLQTPFVAGLKCNLGQQQTLYLRTKP
jgi:hypothetical protein